MRRLRDRAGFYFTDRRDVLVKNYGADGHDGGKGENADIDNHQA